MNVTSVPGPNINEITASTNGNPAPSQSEARQRAIDILINKGSDATKSSTTTIDKSQSQQHPVTNPTQVAAEEMSAIKAASQEVVQAEQAVEQAVEEVKAAEPEEVQEKEKNLSRQYAILARKEKELRNRARSFQAREEALKAREQELTTKSSQYETGYIAKDKLMSDPLSVLAETGITYDQLTQMALNATQQDPVTRAAIARLEAEVKSEKAAREDLVQKIQQSQNDQYKQAIRQIRSDVRDLVSSDQSYETIRETNSVNDVVELIEETFKRDGRVMGVDEAAQEVENYLVDKLAGLSRIEKIQKRLQASAKAANTQASTTAAASSGQQKKQEEIKKQPQTQQLKTLTNSVGTSGKLSARERAILKFKGEL